MLNQKQYYEEFKLEESCKWEKGSKGKYHRNPEESCDAEIVYCNPESNFFVIKKTHATWDKDSNGNEVSPSYSVCWKINKGPYLMGLPNDAKGRQFLSGLFNK